MYHNTLKDSLAAVHDIAAIRLHFVALMLKPLQRYPEIHFLKIFYSNKKIIAICKQFKTQEIKYKAIKIKDEMEKAIPIIQTNDLNFNQAHFL